VPAERLCRACFDGDYPLGVAAEERGKYVLEDAGGTRP
jgi:amidophosphoribosyltransferase